jgi:hypothetical protein
MKHFPSPLRTQVYYYNKWKSNSMGGILSLVLALVSVFWGTIFAIYYSNPWAAISCFCIGVFFFFIMAIRFSDASNYYDRYLRSTINPTDNTTKQ